MNNAPNENLRNTIVKRSATFNNSFVATNETPQKNIAPKGFEYLIKFDFMEYLLLLRQDEVYTSLLLSINQN